VLVTHRAWRTGIAAASVLAAATLACLALAAPAGAADRYASPDGTAASPCADPEDPCPIAVAVNEANSGDDVTLLGGRPPEPPFTSSVTLGFACNPGCATKTGITIHGSPGSRPVINLAVPQSNSGFVVGLGSALRDVVVSSTTNSSTAVVASGGAVERISSHASGGDSAACSAGAGATYEDTTCWYTGSGGPNSHAFGGFANFTSFTDEVTLRNVTAVATTGPGIRARSAGTIQASIVVEATNVIARGGGGAGGEDVLTDQAFAGANQEVHLSHSNYATESETAEGDITDPGSGTNQTTAPVFVDASTGDFRQAGGSAGTLDLGSAAGLAFGDFDFEGGGRIQGGVPDIGADERPAPPAPPVLTGTAPGSGGNQNAVRVIGLAEPGSTVEVHANGTCSGSPVAMGTAATLESPGIGVTVPDNSTTSFSATATNGEGESGCSTATVSYTEVTPPPTGTTPDPRGAKKKKCKRKKKGKKRSAATAAKKKKKCKKRKKKRR
jgi:flagellin-like hook-associated protein FlgL